MKASPGPDPIMPENRKTQAPQIDPRSPLVLDTRELGRRPGSMKRLRRPVPAPDGFGLELIGVPRGANVDLDLRLESVMEGVLVSGTATMTVEGECGRCLDPLSEAVVVNLQELYAYPDSAAEYTSNEEEIGRLQGDLIDLEPVLRDAVVLALPTNPLCREDCPGLCSECGEHWDQLPSDHNHEQVDPRWAALQNMIEPSPDEATRSQEK
jgi:uncharacterized protein